MPETDRQSPLDLPAPVDDGAADHLPGKELPSLALRSTTGEPVDLADAGEGTLVLYCYPRTGRPGEAIPPEWDRIPGARGCTRESCAFRDHSQDLQELGARVLGLSAQPLDEQREFARREGIPYPLLSDPELRLAGALGLPTFPFEGRRYYRRLTLIGRERRVVKVFYPVFPPERSAADVLAWLQSG
jgi:peroxiredoxin